MNDKKIRVRFAPSPTGYMHIGNFRTALYGYLFAKKNNGVFILRIEDTDKDRFVKDALEKLIEIMQWAGFDYDEGVYAKSQVESHKPARNASHIEAGGSKVIESKNYPEFVEVGDYGPYVQSERLKIYQKYAKTLVEKRNAYYCFCSPEKLEEMRNLQIAQKKAPMYDRSCLNLSPEKITEKIKKGEKYVIRQKIKTEGFTEYEDIIRGKISIKNELLEDQILLKSNGYPTYNFANVIDDHLMEISHVTRGDEYVSSTPKFVQLYENFGWEIPQFAHLPLLLNPDKSKLSKRQGDVAVEDYIQKGYLKEAIINFVALLGWNPGEGNTQEIFSLEELIREFDLARVHKAGAVFDLKKLDWLNAQYIKKLSLDELYKKSLDFFQQKDFYLNASAEKKSEEYLKKVLIIEQERLNNFSAVGESNKFFFQDINYAKELLRWKKISDEDLKESLEKSQEVLEKISDSNWTKENLEKNLLEAAGDKPARNITHSVAGGKGELLWPLRAALTGEQKSPSPFECAWVLGKKASRQRISQALSLI